MSSEFKRKFALMCCAAISFSFAACGDESGSVGNKGDQGVKCGDSVCTGEQVCEDGVCKDKPKDDPCAKCGADQTCEDGVCKDKPKDDPCAKCGADQTCEDGVCKDKPKDDPCAKCEAGQVCDPDAGTCMDPPEDPCAKCTDKQECVNFECVDIDPCANKTCPDNTRCDREQDGQCVDIDPCETVVCLADQTCIQAQCIDNACIENGVEKDCGEGQTCSKGECVDDGCQNKTCGEGYQCIKGLCEETACINYFCDEGRTCKGGTCVDNECLDKTCDEGMVCSKGSCTYEICLSKEACSAGKFCNAEGACEFINAPAISLDEPEDKTSDESGKAVSLTLHLNNAPTAEVRVGCEVVSESQNKEVEVACEEIVFNADNWQNEQTVLVTGVDDYLKDGDQVYKIKVTTSSEDADFNGLVTESVELTNIDMTKPGFVFSETSLTTYEDQESPAATFTVQLSSIPSSEVRLTVSSSNAKEGTVEPGTLIFNKDNWGEPQTVTVQGQDDNVRDGNVNYTVFFAPSESNDEDYNGIQASPIKVTNIDNDVAGLNINIPAEDFEVLEGQNQTILVKLNTQPKKEVKIAMVVDNKDEVAFNVPEITLDAESWNTGKSVYLSGISDYIIDGDKPVKVTFTAASEDEDYNLEPVVFDALVKDVDVADLVVNMGDAPVVKEGSNDMVTMSVSLASKPTKDVTVAVSVTDDSELKVNKKSLTFKPDYWDIGQDILVNSVDDEIVDGNVKSKVVMALTSGDSNFNSKVKEVEFTTVDDDIAGFLISSNAASFPENSGSSITMDVSLQSQPTADVKVTVSSTDASELVVDGVSSLTFTKANWKTPQKITAKVVDDKIADGTQTAQIKFVAASEDPNFNKIEGLSAVYTITDDDAPSVALSIPVTTVTYASPSTDAAIVLGVQPTSNVTVTLSSPDSKAVTFSPSTLTFTTSNYNVEQKVKVNVNFDGMGASSNATISAKAAGTGYNATSNNVVLSLINIPEVQNFAYTGGVQNVTLPAGKYKFEVWGAQGGSGLNTTGGNGGYAVGTITLPAKTNCYVVVGGAGGKPTAGYNGGGLGGTDTGSGQTGGGGGGATDIRCVANNLNNRVIVAGGGAGGGRDGSTGVGGGASGTVSAESYSQAKTGNPGTQNAAGTCYETVRGATSGAFGVGGNGSTNHNAAGGGGGGGGWYGGGGGVSTVDHGSGWSSGGGGGSAYVLTSSSYKPAGYAMNSASYYLINAQMTAGNVSFLSPAGASETGHPGNGYARITLVK